MEARVKVHLNFKERTAIWEALKDVCTSITDTTCQYNEGWSDAKVAETVNGRGTADHVKSIREDMLGRLMPRSEGNANQQIKALHSLIFELNARVVALQDWAAKRPRAPFER